MITDGANLINFIIESNLIQADAPGLIIWSANSIDQLNAWLEERDGRK
jgi:hypothetical protein